MAPHSVCWLALIPPISTRGSTLDDSLTSGHATEFGALTTAALSEGGGGLSCSSRRQSVDKVWLLIQLQRKFWCISGEGFEYIPTKSRSFWICPSLIFLKSDSSIAKWTCGVKGVNYVLRCVLYVVCFVVIVEVSLSKLPSTAPYHLLSFLPFSQVCKYAELSLWFSRCHCGVQGCWLLK